MVIVADESVDFDIIKGLRQKKINVLAISEDYAGITDKRVLEIAIENQSLLLTEDKDFGELTYRLRVEHRGILLIRLSDLPRDKRIETVLEIIEIHYEKLKKNFSVISKRGLRIKTYSINR